VFEKLRQADNTTARHNTGLGLGLAIVRHLVEMHGGTVHAESPGLGQGALFTVKLPLQTMALYDRWVRFITVCRTGLSWESGSARMPSTAGALRA